MRSERISKVDGAKEKNCPDRRKITPVVCIFCCSYETSRSQNARIAYGRTDTERTTRLASFCLMWKRGKMLLKMVFRAVMTPLSRHIHLLMRANSPPSSGHCLPPSGRPIPAITNLLISNEIYGLIKVPAITFGSFSCGQDVISPTEFIPQQAPSGRGHDGWRGGISGSNYVWLSRRAHAGPLRHFINSWKRQVRAP